MNTRTWMAALWLGTAWLAPLPASAENPQTPPASTKPAAAKTYERFYLKNGMEVILLANHRVPAVSHMLWFNVGASDDPRLKSGLAHYLEHMMFRGTKTRKPGEFSNIINQSGGNDNAFTGHDATVYYVNIAKDKLPIVMAMEADRMQHLVMDEKDALREREVILEERRLRIDNQPQALFSEQVNAALFQNHAYQTPVIGWEHEMRGLTRDDVYDFYRRYYHSGNVRLIVTGDMTVDELKPLAEKYYGSLPPGPRVVREDRTEPPAIAARRVILHHEAVKQPQIARDYLAPSAVWGEVRHAMPLALLSQIMGGGKTSRLYQTMVVEQKIATEVEVNYNALARGPAPFSLEAIPREGVPVEQLEAAFLAAIQKVQAEPVSEEELRRAKTLYKAEAVFARDGLQSLGYVMGWIRAVGLEPDYFDQWDEMVDAVTPQQIMEAARAVLRDEQSVTGLLLPKADATPKEGEHAAP